MPDATLEVQRLVVKETHGGKEEIYVIDLTSKKVSPSKHESANSLEVVLKSAEPEVNFSVVAMPCGGAINKTCGIIELPKNYPPGLACTWTWTVEDTIEYKFDTFKMDGEGDKLSIKGVQQTTKPEDGQLVTGGEIKFEAGALSDGETEFKISFKKEGAKYPEIDPNNCKPFYFEWDEDYVRTETDRKIPSRMMDDIGPKIEGGKKVPRIFRYKGESTKPDVAGKPSTYVNEGLIIQQIKSKRTEFNYFSIGQQAWQWFDTKKQQNKAIKATTCPYEWPEWNFKGKKYPNMKAKEASKEELDADGACDPQPLFNAN